ncbi:hypothetical protein JK176_12600 [Gluconobacter sp. Dm-73]|uniref:hypothetical protein n=1 Tax=Gluconobacter sp. Dm-73 TaxID=2799802 RepID=UPI001B8B5E62|nr:hypothetical protein [Gluconobacter sp. Dm-73]MBS1075720.1 hypothetical protein [Gluconobacter sp. Dm-73]
MRNPQLPAERWIFQCRLSGNSSYRLYVRHGGDFDPDAFKNLSLLYPTCLTKIDQAPEAYPRNTLLDWKANHLGRLPSEALHTQFVARENCVPLSHLALAAR